MIRIEQIISSYKAYVPDADIVPLQKAYILAGRLLGGDGPVAIQEHLEVARVLIELKLDLESVVAGMLYSTIKNNRANYGELASQIGEPTAKLVDSLDHFQPAGLGVESRDALALSMRAMVDAAAKDPRVIFVILAIRLVRLRSWSGLTNKKVKNFAAETLELFAPLAERLGLNHQKIELEDLSFAILYPEEFASISRFLVSKQLDHQSALERTQRIIEKILQAHGINARFYHRIKHCFSIYTKAQKYQVSYEDVHDLLGLRVIVDETELAYHALGLVHGRFTPVQGRFKDYIAFPKANGYQSIHTAVVNDEGQGFEIQIRTAEMHHIAEIGVAAHWSYKLAGTNRAAEKKRSMPWLDELSKSLTITSDPKESLEIFTRELYSDLVYAFSPKGRIHRLPLGATVLDFAYAVHTQLGHHCRGAKIDGQVVPIHHRIKHGDQVMILTEDSEHPTPAWLGYANTNRALSSIRSELRKTENQEALKLGKDIFSEQMARIGLKGEDYLSSVEFGKFLKYKKYKSDEAFLIDLGFGNCSVNELKVFLIGQADSKSWTFSKKIMQTFGRKAEGVVILGLEDQQFKLAKCCNPLKGDDILGVMIQGEGVSIHQTDCKNLRGIDPKRLVDASWDFGKEERTQVRLLLHFDQDIKTHFQIMKILVSAKVRILECHHRLVENKSTEEINIEVASLDQFAKILKRLNGLNQVTARRLFEPETPAQS
ncbi:MAG: hypothetical protein A2527_06285 [Candidatus Lambdaproteobacteria bacterium RIFOXYD2_FULL_50_16]|uniref:GTP pyrophosphokinase n=1 Tax=Candidatus Lambdaproteobacteria bacterium RIFOXYD2_FULL_50_16 TaxID=1817772 RepID=A0A1F6GA18_9PROT|nr:MAG: hypothetical protein A2527_06285 [Candidatus Lambdaproteobacteria bacterium RIFOXYD2_FULL_50_16]